MEQRTAQRGGWRLLLTAHGFSQLGNYVQNLALPLWVLAVTGSYTATGITFAVGTLPVIVCAPIAGAIVDRFDRRTVLVASEILCAALVLVLLLGVSEQNLVLIYVVVAALKAVGSVSVPAVQAMVKTGVEKSELRRVISMFEMVFGLTMTFGPLIGAALSAGIGIETAIWANFTSFVVGGLLALFVRSDRNAAVASSEPEEPGKVSVRTVLADGQLRRVALAEAAFFLFLGSEVVIALSVFQGTIGMGAAAAYQGLAGVGWVAASYFVVRRASKQNAVVWAGTLLAVLAAALLMVDLSGFEWVVVVMVGLLGGAGNVMVAGAATVVYQTRTPSAATGRVFAYRRAVLNLLMTVSYVAIPAFADLTGRPAAVLVVAASVNAVVTTVLLRKIMGGRTE